MKQETISLVNRRLAQATETLEVAREVWIANHYRDAINRSYYAMFYAGLALLAARLLGTSKHSGVLSLFGKHFVKTGLFSAEAGQHLHHAFDLRQKSDYREDFDPTREQAEEILVHAETFLAETHRVWKILQSCEVKTPVSPP